MPFVNHDAGHGWCTESIQSSVQLAEPLPIRMETVYLRTLTGGRVNPWMAPALRGLFLKPLRDHFCGLQGGWEAATSRGDGLEHRVKSQLGTTGQRGEGQAISPLRVGSDGGNGKGNAKGDGRPGYCEGCAKIGRCLYGRVFEPDLVTFAPQLIEQGARQGLRGITLATQLLSDEREFLSEDGQDEFACREDRTVWLEAGEYIPVRLLCVGRESLDLLPLVVEALDAFGQESGLWGRPNVRVAVDNRFRESIDWELRPETLPMRLGEGTVPSVTLRWMTPLSLKRRGGESKSSRRMPTESSPIPSYYDLFSHSVRTVRRAVMEFGSGYSFDVRDFSRGEFVRAADTVPLLSHDLRFFEQARGSRRNDSHRQAGWLGTMTFADIPASHLPWLVWASRLGIGDSRNIGTGLWTMEMG